MPPENPTGKPRTFYVVLVHNTNCHEVHCFTANRVQADACFLECAERNEAMDERHYLTMATLDNTTSEEAAVSLRFLMEASLYDLVEARWLPWCPDMDFPMPEGAIDARRLSEGWEQAAQLGRDVGKYLSRDRIDPPYMTDGSRPPQETVDHADALLSALMAKHASKH